MFRMLNPNLVPVKIKITLKQLKPRVRIKMTSSKEERELTLLPLIDSISGQRIQSYNSNKRLWCSGNTSASQNENAFSFFGRQVNIQGFTRSTQKKNRSKKRGATNNSKAHAKEERSRVTTKKGTHKLLFARDTRTCFFFLSHSRVFHCVRKN